MIKISFFVILITSTINLFGQEIGYHNYKVLQIDSSIFENYYLISCARAGKFYKILSKKDSTINVLQLHNIKNIEIGKFYNLNLEKIYYFISYGYSVPFLGGGLDVDTIQILKKGECFYQSNQVISRYFIYR